MSKSAPVKKTTSKIWDKVKDVVDPDRALQATVAAAIEGVAVRNVLGMAPETWKPGKPLKLLLAGYVGTRNTGADVRVEEMIRQLRHVVGDDQLELTIMTVDPKLTRGYFRAVHQIELPAVFPKFIATGVPQAPRRHRLRGARCSSRSSRARLTCFMAGALGLANAENKVSVGYGAEAGNMTPALRDFVRDAPARSRSSSAATSPRARSSASSASAPPLGPTPPGPSTPLRCPGAPSCCATPGWDGRQKVLVVCPINPFWWPVKPDLLKYAAYKLGGQYKHEHYSAFYFHHHGEASDKKYNNVRPGPGRRCQRVRRGARVLHHPRRHWSSSTATPCEDLQPRLDRGGALFVSDAARHVRPRQRAAWLHA